MGRGSKVHLIVAAALMVCCSNMIMALGYNYRADDTASEYIHVEGTVLCQDCSKGWNDWIQGTPLNGSVVSITCMDERKKIVKYASHETDEFGHYGLTMKMTCGTSGKKIDPKGCRARLVSSRDPSCNVFTNFGGGVRGVRLDRPTSIYRDSIKYTLEPMYFTSPMCEKPETGDHSPNYNNGNY